MADETRPDESPLGDFLADAPAPASTKRKLRKRQLLDTETAEDAVRSILERVDSAVDERSDWIQKRLSRYAKLRGWLNHRDWPWDNASNQHISLMLANCLRVEAGLFNAVLGMRPVVMGKPLQRVHREMAEANDSLLDHQMFVDQDGERRVEKFILQFVEDGTAFSFQPRVHERRTFVDTRVCPSPQDGEEFSGYVAQKLSELVEENRVEFSSLLQTDEDGYRWTGFYLDPEQIEREVTIRVYDKDERSLEILFEWEAVIYDGPAMLVKDLEDVVAPMRSENLQPVSAHNPTGAPWVATISKVPLDEIRRLKREGTYDVLTDEDLDDLEALAQGRTDRDPVHDEDEIREAKDAVAGLNPAPAGGHQDDKVFLTVIAWYGPYDLNDDGLAEEAIFTVIREGAKLARVRYLTELYPGLPPHRPFAEARFIPVPGQLYGIGLPELMEGLNDFLHALVNQNVDAGTLANMPWFGYRASSGFKPDTVRLSPGEGLALDNPMQDLVFYNLPNADQSWSFNMIGLGMQFLERLTSMGAFQFGQVPQGKASALRTVGTTMAILQQGAAMPEQILRRLFMGLKDVYAQFHMLNTRFLPPHKRYLVTGRPLDSDEAYGQIDDRKDISIPLTFDFQATLLNTNKGLVAQSLVALGAALINPLTMQLGLISPEQIYNWAKDLIQANQLDPARYLQRPQTMPAGPRITVEEAILDITNGVMPQSADFIYPTQEALAKLIEFMNSENFGYLQGGKELLFNEYLKRVVERVRLEQQQAQLSQAAGQFAQALEQGGGGQGAGRPPDSPPQAPGMQTDTPSQEEIGGAERG